MEATLLFEPIVLLVLGLVMGLLLWRFSGFRERRVRREMARLSIQVKSETNPRKRQEMLQRFQEIGGVKASRRVQSRNSAVDEGRKARMNGRLRISNPYGIGVLGRARMWRLGWQSVDKHIRWIERQRR